MATPRGACMVAAGGHAWLLRGERGCAWDMTRYGDTINERAVRILLECILVTAANTISNRFPFVATVFDRGQRL